MNEETLTRCRSILEDCWDSRPASARVDPDTPLIDLGVDSLTFVALLDRIHHEFGVTWNAANPPEATESLRSLARRVAASGEEPDAPAPAGVDDFRALMSYFPTGVAVVTGRAADSTPYGATCSSLSSVTLTPPTLLVCLRSASRTLSAVRETEQFAVNLLHARARDTAELFASAVIDRFARIPWRPTPLTGSPWLTGSAFAVADCAVSGFVPVGDHTVVLGRVIGIETLPDAPLMYGLRQFSAWAAGSR